MLHHIDVAARVSYKLQFKVSTWRHCHQNYGPIWKCRGNKTGTEVSQQLISDTVHYTVTFVTPNLKCSPLRQGRETVAELIISISAAMLLSCYNVLWFPILYSSSSCKQRFFLFSPLTPEGSDVLVSMHIPWMASLLNVSGLSFKFWWAPDHLLDVRLALFLAHSLTLQTDQDRSRSRNIFGCKSSANRRSLGGFDGLLVTLLCIAHGMCSRINFPRANWS